MSVSSLYVGEADHAEIAPVRDALYPNSVQLQLTPKIALPPLFMVWLCIGSTSRITLAVFISFFPVVVATLTGLTSLDRYLLRSCKAWGR